MRQIVLDTETTGLEPAQGHRIIEIGCVEILNRRITSRRYHQYVNPQRDIDAGAVEVHGITAEDLREKPLFGEIAGDFIEFIRGAELIIHNAAFDVGFLDAEFALLGSAWGRTEDYCVVFDSLKLAREMHPGQRNSLDALCRRYDIDNAHRELHGALLDAELLAEVYLSMTGGQGSLELAPERAAGAADADAARRGRAVAARKFKVIRPSAAEAAAHAETLGRIDEASGGACLWLKS
ncbi:MAG: DNA polymerase III subunit epsilon [Gammaproteobacteria bacterium]|nr:DNA polymerase III subunit epsilon [Gammaproteobacteria bacterium]MCP5202084.1 DNA polymerase III subunit epsilon [Gammaproteobacteria bacterium]